MTEDKLNQTLSLLNQAVDIDACYVDDHSFSFAEVVKYDKMYQAIKNLIDLGAAPTPCALKYAAYMDDGELAEKALSAGIKPDTDTFILIYTYKSSIVLSKMYEHKIDLITSDDDEEGSLLYHLFHFDDKIKWDKCLNCVKILIEQYHYLPSILLKYVEDEFGDYENPVGEYLNSKC